MFEQIDARGCYVRLQKTISEIQATHYYPENLAIVLNQFALAAVLLRDSIKIEGSITIQLRTPGPIKLIMADCLADQRVRAIAEYDVEALAAEDQLDLSSIGEGAVLTITITPEEGERYQSIVPIEKHTLQDCLEDYFVCSEQLPSWFSLNADRQQAVGICLLALPAQKTLDQSLGSENFTRLKYLLHTATPAEALQLSAEDLLTRLFHEESCSVFKPHGLEFGCNCSAQKSMDAIRSLGKSDVQELLAEQHREGNNSLIVDCHFCFQRYQFSLDELNVLLD